MASLGVHGDKPIPWQNRTGGHKRDWLGAVDCVLDVLARIGTTRPSPDAGGDVEARIAVDDDFVTALRERQAAWLADSGQDADTGFHAVEFAGEVDELLNVIKKRMREEGGWRGSRASNEDLQDEFGDVLICLYNLAFRLGVDLMPAARAKFNKTSEKYGFPHRVAVRAASPPQPDQGAGVTAGEVG